MTDSGSALTAVVDVAGLLAAAGACVAALRTAGRYADARRRPWLLLGLGAGAWALGEVYRTWLEVGLQTTVSVPSVADVGSLLLLPCLAVALLLHPAAGARHTTERLRLLLDGVTVLVSLLLFAWPLTVVQALETDGGVAERVTALAYPLGDLLLTALVLTMLTYAACAHRPVLLWVLGGLVALTCADGAFAYLLLRNDTSSVTPADLLWVLGFVALGVAADRQLRDGSERREEPTGPSRDWSGLTYGLVALVGVTIVTRWLLGASVSSTEAGLFTGLGVLVFVRQHTVLRDNRMLLARLADGREQLHQQGLRDGLTGLSNRTSFRHLVDLALASDLAADVPQAHVVMKFRLADARLLDNLSPDDEDALIFEVAARIKGCLQPGDALARVGEATFAVLRAGGPDEGHQLAIQVIAALEDPVQLLKVSRHVRVVAAVANASASHGLTAGELLQRTAVALNSIDSPVGGIAFVDERVLRAQAERVELQEALVQDVRVSTDEAIEAIFEPVVNLIDGTLAGVSVRAGWRHPTAGTISGGALANLAREAGLSAQVDDALLQKALSAYGEWVHRLPTYPPHLWVTVSGDSISSTGFCERLSVALELARVAPAALLLDPIDNSGESGSVRRRLDQVRAVGCEVVMNDVMTIGDQRPKAGETFQVSSQLVDRCVIDLPARRLIETTVEFAKVRGAQTAARNVVTAEQHEQLQALGCRVGRGPLYGAGLTAAEMGGLLAESAAGTYRATPSATNGRTRSSHAWQELRSIVSSLPVAALACTADGTIVLAEGGLFEHLGVQAGSLIGHSITRIVQRNNIDEGPLARALAGEAMTATFQIGDRWLEARLHPVYGSDGAVNGLMSMAIDISDRVQAEQAMRESEHRFRVIFDQAPIGVALIGPDACVQQVNTAMATMVGHTPEELEGRHMKALWHADTPADSEANFEAFRAGGGPGYRTERAFKHQDGSPVWTRVTVGPLGNDSAPGSVIGIVEDLRELKALELELRHAQKLESIGMLAAGIAHEINTPIQFVGDNLTFLEDAFRTVGELLETTERLVQPLNEAAGIELAAKRDAADLTWLQEEIPSAITQSIEGIGRVSTIVQAMRNFGHPDGRDPAAIDINTAIRDTTTVTRNEYKYVADLVLELGDVPSVLGYPSEFNQVILNLIVNASHAIANAIEGTTGRGTICIRSWSDETLAHISVTDDGCGMSAQTALRVFDPFFTTKPVGQGTGQGLAISHSVIVDKHGGSIDVASQPGVGTTFTVHLPFTPPFPKTLPS